MNQERGFDSPIVTRPFLLSTTSGSALGPIILLFNGYRSLDTTAQSVLRVLTEGNTSRYGE
jgi:hypothetical protein